MGLDLWFTRKAEAHVSPENVRDLAKAENKSHIEPVELNAGKTIYVSTSQQLGYWRKD